MRIILAVFLSFFIFSSALAQTRYSNLIIFGDSLSDAASYSDLAGDKNSEANNYWVGTQGLTGAPITSELDASGQRLLWGNYLAQMLFDQTLYPSIQAKLIGIDPNKDSVDFAWASAQSGSNYINDNSRAYYPPVNNLACQSFGPGLIKPGDSCVPGVNLQIQSYLKAVNNKPNPDTLFIIWAGGNDIFNNIYRIVWHNKKSNKILLLLKMLQAAYPSTSNALGLSNPAKNIYADVELLLKRGVKKDNIYVLNLPNISKTPVVRKMTKGSKIALYDLALISFIYDKALQYSLKSTLSSGHIISIKQLVNGVIKDPRRYDFSNVSDSCVADKKTPYCKGYVFFNNKHPSSRAHAVIALYVYKVINS